MKNRYVFFKLFFMLFALLINGCSCEQDVTDVKSTLLADPSEIDFGKVEIFQTKELTITVTTEGGRDVELGEIELKTDAPDGVFLIEKVTEGVDSFNTLKPGKKRQIKVFFSPVDTVTYNGTLLIQSDANNPENGTVEIPMTGEGVLPDLHFEPWVLDFGQVKVGEEKSLTTEIVNSGSQVYVLDFAEITSGISVFSMSSSIKRGDTIEPGGRYEVVVTFKPIQNINYNGSIEFKATDPSAGVAHLSLMGEGTSPCIQLEPSGGTFFGYTEPNQPEDVTILVKNGCNGELSVDSLSIEDDTESHFSIIDAPGTPFTIPPYDQNDPYQSQTEVVLRYDGVGDQGCDEASLKILSNDPVNGELIYNLLGCKGVPPDEPDIHVTPDEYNFGVVIRGEDKSADFIIRNLGGQPLIIQSIEIVGAGELSTDGLDPQDMTIPQDPSVTRTVTVTTHCALPKTVTANLEIKSNDPDESTLDVPITLVCYPSDVGLIHLELVWDKDNTDMDLHFVSPGGKFCDLMGGSDCYYCNKHPDWGLSGEYADDPFLDRDDTDGFGPENMNLNTSPYSGEYTVMVHYYNDKGMGPANATVKLYFYDQLQKVITRTLTHKQLWKVMTISLPEQSVEVVDQIVGMRDCGCSN